MGTVHNVIFRKIFHYRDDTRSVQLHWYYVEESAGHIALYAGTRLQVGTMRYPNVRAQRLEPGSYSGLQVSTMRYSDVRAEQLEPGPYSGLQVGTMMGDILMSELSGSSPEPQCVEQVGAEARCSKGDTMSRRGDFCWAMYEDAALQANLPRKTVTDRTVNIE